MEQATDTAEWLGMTGHHWHRAGLRMADVEEWSWVDPSDRVDGFVVLAGLAAPGPIELRRVVVDPALRGSGRGRALVLAAIDRVRALPGRDRIWLDVRRSNARARALYDDLGFTPCAAPNGEPDPDLAHLALDL